MIRVSGPACYFALSCFLASSRRLASRIQYSDSPMAVRIIVARENIHCSWRHRRGSFQL